MLTPEELVHLAFANSQRLKLLLEKTRFRCAVSLSLAERLKLLLLQHAF